VTYAFLALSYLLGATPTSYWVGRAVHGLDLREHGSGNLGATNAFRVLGWKSALPVVFVDIAKGYVPAAMFGQLAGVGFPWTLAFGTAAIFGHMFSVWVGFKGGKGMATSAGAFLALAPWAVLGGLIVWLVLAFGTGYVSLASIAAAALLPVFIGLTPHEGGTTLVGFSSALALFVIVKHRTNIGRLLRGEENRFRRGSRAGAEKAAGGVGGAPDDAAQDRASPGEPR
jgi:glycerol-3-phosphate acyltransferase PlsY